ncbi:MAG: SDR family oxidoreductase [Actinomycetaceae bacterium]|nr:SDR family oxidoreductase [Actinomycetaceae bacterium]
MTGVDFALVGTAVVTGGASGIGQAVAIALAGQGAKVAILDLPKSDCSTTLDAINGIGGEAVAIPCDVSDESSVTQAVNAAEDRFGPLRYAVNAAGIANAAPCLEMPLLQWQRMYDVDVTGVFLCCQAEGRAMVRAGGGAIVNIASMSGTIVNRGLLQVHYNSAKAAVAHLSKSLAMELIREGIRVNAISPGYIATPMNTRAEVADQAKQFAADTPIGRMGEPEEIAGPIAFLLSPAASFITGVDLLVDGGFCCW